jgi:hypothetical protein
VIPCSLVEARQYFGRTYSLQLKSQIVGQTNHQAAASELCLLLAGGLLGLLFDPEDGGNTSF